jgi:hypothetical protein
MPEPTLTLPRSKLQGHIGDRLGWGSGPDNGEEEWSDRKLRKINDLLDSALRTVYFEASVDGSAPHRWSWLTPTGDFTMASGERTLLLPLDFEGFVGPKLTVTLASSDSVYSAIPIVGDPYLDAKYAGTSDATGRPQFAAVRDKVGTGPSNSSRRELYVYPEPDQAYVLRGQYSLIPDALTASWPYAYGGAPMSEVFKFACRAMAEAELDNIAPQEGVEWPHYMRCLKLAIGRDGRRQPKTLGRNLDYSDPSRRFGGRRGWWSGGHIGYVDPVTLDGSAFE